MTWNRTLISYLPENYPASRETVDFQAALQPEIDGIWRARDEILAQLDAYTATWGLSLWEEALGIKNAQGLDLELRRRQVAAKLQGRGTTTVKVVKDLAETMLGVPVEVIEHYAQYVVELEPAAGGKLPAGAAQLRERLEEILPAHLDWQLVATIWMDYIIGMALGPRWSTARLDRRRWDQMALQPVWSTALGPRWSTAGASRRQGVLPNDRAVWGAALGPRRSAAGAEVKATPPLYSKILNAVRCGGPVSSTILPSAG